MMYVLIGADSGRIYSQHKYKETLFKLLAKKWPTKTSVNGNKSCGSAVLEKKMPEPMRIMKLAGGMYLE